MIEYLIIWALILLVIFNIITYFKYKLLKWIVKILEWDLINTILQVWKINNRLIFLYDNLKTNTEEILELQEVIRQMNTKNKKNAKKKKGK